MADETSPKGEADSIRKVNQKSLPIRSPFQPPNASPLFEEYERSARSVGAGRRLETKNQSLLSSQGALFAGDTDHRVVQSLARFVNVATECGKVGGTRGSSLRGRL